MTPTTAWTCTCLASGTSPAGFTTAACVSRFSRPPAFLVPNAPLTPPQLRDASLDHGVRLRRGADQRGRGGPQHGALHGQARHVRTLRLRAGQGACAGWVEVGRSVLRGRAARGARCLHAPPPPLFPRARPTRPSRPSLPRRRASRACCCVLALCGRRAAHPLRLAAAILLRVHVLGRGGVGEFWGVVGGWSFYLLVCFAVRSKDSASAGFVEPRCCWSGRHLTQAAAG